MKTFNEWFKQHVNEGFFSKSVKEKLPEMTDDQRDTYDKLRNTGMGHEETLKIVMGEPTIHRPVSQSRLDYEKVMDTAFERGHRFEK